MRAFVVVLAVAACTSWVDVELEGRVVGANFTPPQWHIVEEDDGQERMVRVPEQWELVVLTSQGLVFAPSTPAEVRKMPVGTPVMVRARLEEKSGRVAELRLETTTAVAQKGPET